MSFRSMRTLESWLDEFLALGYAFDGDVRVVPQDGAEDANTGLVVVQIADPPTVISIQPEPQNPMRWMVTLEPRESAVTLPAPQVLNFAAELSVLAALCAFLQAKSLQFDGFDHP
ncbi:hypothetical protein [Microbacterium mangrovi]|uniref:hypothetical protein n=1 Tax=Microbacterium mangrovi TaxID=1348253 RepID=UPI00068F99A1|nr:hypothetical protein [Microbacterium mangrovi]